MGLILYLATGNRNLFIQREEIKSKDDFLIAAESEKSLDLSQNRSVKGTAITPDTAGKNKVKNPAQLCRIFILR